tara:strand:+ start:163 stop:357 length:195 start_codon:yes stop_codon:yes gene_type:complete
LIELGYITAENAEIIYEINLDQHEVDGAVARLKESLVDRNDIKTLFLQIKSEDYLNRYGYIDFP